MSFNQFLDTEKKKKKIHLFTGMHFMLVRLPMLAAAAERAPVKRDNTRKQHLHHKREYLATFYHDDTFKCVVNNNDTV